MPKVSKTSHKKRQGQHHRHSKRYVKIYAPYLPLVISIIASLLISFIHPVAGRVLPYATEMSVGGLFSATNSHRAAHGVGALALNSALNDAAQAKANDMVARNYWSHNTPDEQPPWVFIDATGYKYTKAGENLAYGFAASSDTVQGWMNSPSHRANMLDSGFTHAGFGFANSPNFVGNGEQTVVVAFYATPTTPPPPPPPPAPAQAPPPPAVQPTSPTNTPTPEAAPEPEPEEPEEDEEDPTPVTTATPITPESEPQAINRMSLVGASWTLGAITLVLGGLVLFRLFHLGLHLQRFIKHHPKLKHALHDGERLILHHPLFDSIIIGLAIFGYSLSRVVGVIL